MFASGCSPPHLSVTQLPSATEVQLPPIGTFTQLLLCACGRTRDGSPQPSDSFARPAPVGAKSWGTPAMCPHQALPRHLLHWLRLSLRTCEIIRKSRARAEKAGWQGAREGASPLRAVTERATPPDGLFCSRPKGCVSLACVAQAGQPTEGRQPAGGSPGDAKHRQPAAGIAAAFVPWPSQKSSATRLFPNYFTGSYSESRFSLRAPRPLREESLDPGFNSS